MIFHGAELPPAALHSPPGGDHQNAHSTERKATGFRYYSGRAGGNSRRNGGDRSACGIELVHKKTLPGRRSRTEKYIVHAEGHWRRGTAQRKGAEKAGKSWRIIWLDKQQIEVCRPSSVR